LALVGITTYNLFVFDKRQENLIIKRRNIFSETITQVMLQEISQVEVVVEEKSESRVYILKLKLTSGEYIAISDSFMFKKRCEKMAECIRHWIW